MITLVRKNMPQFVNEAVNACLHDFNKAVLDEPFFARPAVNVAETDTHFELEVTLPGFNKNEIFMSTEKGFLKITAEKQNLTSEQMPESNNKKYTRKEFVYNAFKRTFEIPELVNVDAIAAKYENGILYVTMPKKEHHVSPSRSIEVA